GIRDWPGVLGYFMLGGEDVKRYSDAARLNTDDRLTLEFSAPRALYLNSAMPNWTLMEGFKRAELPEFTPGSRGEIENAQVRQAIGAAYLARRVLPEALAQFRRAIELDPNNTEARVESARVSLDLNLASDALALAQKVLERDPRNSAALRIAGLAAL